MATDLNRCEFIGRLGANPEMRDMKNGEKFTTFSVAVNESWTSKTGEKVKKTEWINIIAYRKLAEICGQYLVKGSHVYLAGKFATNKYQDKDGIERTSFQIVLDQMQMLGTKFHQDEATAPKEEASAKATHEEFDTDTIPF